jgi:hypothetical protein
LEAPALTYRPCRAPPIRRSQCRYVWNRLPELTTEMAQNRSRQIFQRSQCRAGHAKEAELQAAPIQCRDRKVLRMVRRSRALSVNHCRNKKSGVFTRRLASVRPRPPLALSIGEQEYLLGVLDSDRFADTAPATATSLDEGRYHGSARTMYRLLATHSQVGDRRRQRRHPGVYVMPTPEGGGSLASTTPM